MKKVYYEKVGRKYVPIKEYDSDFMDALHKGTHVVMSYPGGQSCRYGIDPAYAPMIAAGRIAEDAITKSMMEFSALKPRDTPITPGQKAAWEKLNEEFDNDRYMLQYPSMRDVAEAGVKAMQEEAAKLMKHEAVKQAYEQFLVIAELAREHNDNAS